MAGETFQKIYDFVKEIPVGYVVNYGIVANAINTSSRVIGFALHSNPDQSNIPCHRVVFKDGSLAKGFAFGGEDKQREILEKEGIRFDNEGRVLRKYFWEG
ncbi:MAG: MGMT family protein [Candidatus Margulisbacteria bacterium]|nr:MGMT family protein [Candidatus Margulisiibacteriota bacterium]